MKTIKPEHNDLTIRRVNNGWVVASDVRYRGIGEEHVARTPKELADLLQDWAQQQGDLPEPRRTGEME